jgi:hypothetical protein
VDPAFHDLIPLLAFHLESAQIDLLKSPAPYRQTIALAQVRLVGGVNQHLRYQTVTTFSVSRIPNTRPLPMTAVVLSVFKNIPPHFNALYAQKDLLVHTIYALICVLTPMSALSYVQCVGKRSPDSMIESVMKDFILARRSLYAKANSSKVASGVVVVVSLERMP